MVSPLAPGQPEFPGQMLHPREERVKHVHARPAVFLASGLACVQYGPELRRRSHGRRIVRHPYYAAGLLVVALFDDFTTTTVAWRGVFMLYLLLGAWLEERKLLTDFGDAYRRYRREVPALLPRRLIP